MGVVMSCTRRFVNAAFAERRFPFLQREFPYRATFTFRLKAPRVRHGSNMFFGFGIGFIDLDRHHHTFEKVVNVRNRAEFDQLYSQLDQGECWECGHVDNCKDILSWQRKS